MTSVFVLPDTRLVMISMFTTSVIDRDSRPGRIKS